MIKKALKFLVLLPFLGAVACGGPKVIPDNTLSDILLDMFLVNAYSANLRNVSYDSINIYEPILNDYGYNTKDFTHTLANFTKRRSAKLAKIISTTNDKLDRMLASINKQIEKEDYIDSLAWKLTMQTVYTDSLIQIRSLADTTKLRARIPARSSGTYKISYNYLQDSTDKNNNLFNRHSLLEKNGKQIINTSQRIVRGRETKNYETSLAATAKTDSLELWFGGYRPENKEKPYFTVDSLRVIWLPSREEARRQYLLQFIDYRLVIDSMDVTDIMYGDFGKRAPNILMNFPDEEIITIRTDEDIPADS